jgi:hypothetical protein
MNDDCAAKSKNATTENTEITEIRKRERAEISEENALQFFSF